jgi:hypothetical protein
MLKLSDNDFNSVDNINLLSSLNNKNYEYILAKCPTCGYQLAVVNLKFFNKSDLFLFKNLFNQGWVISLDYDCEDVIIKRRDPCCPPLGVASLFKTNDDTEDEDELEYPYDEYAELKSYINEVTEAEIIRASFDSGYKYIGIIDSDGKVIKSEEADPSNIKEYKRWIKNNKDCRLKLIK